MGGAHIALKPDSTMPVFINTGNPAAYALIRMTTLEVGGNFNYYLFRGTSSTIKKWNTNFAYGALGFPIKNKGGACFGIMPYSSMGYDLKNVVEAPAIGPVTYLYNGSGGLNRVFAGYGVMPFNLKLTKFRKKYLYKPDSATRLSHFSYKTRENVNKLLSDLAVGFNANYIFGSLEQTSRVVYPNSVMYNNTFRHQAVTLGDFSGNFGLQTAFTIDSASGSGKRKALKEKVKITFGAFLALNSTLKGTYDVSAYNYFLDGFGDEKLRDTVLYAPGQVRQARLHCLSSKALALVLKRAKE
jgi:hypothetical protein